LTIGNLLEHYQFDNGHFRKCNDWLALRYGDDEVIDWSLVPTKVKPTAPSNKENSATLGNVASVTTKVSKPSCPDEDPTVDACPADEFDDADALAALAAIEDEIE
jgi:uracil-DNA glycosylase